MSTKPSPVIHYLAGARAETPLSSSGGCAESGKPQSATETAAAAASSAAATPDLGILAIGVGTRYVMCWPVRLRVLQMQDYYP